MGATDIFGLGTPDSVFLVSFKGDGGWEFGLDPSELADLLFGIVIGRSVSWNEIETRQNSGDLK